MLPRNKDCSQSRQASSTDINSEGILVSPKVNISCKEAILNTALNLNASFMHVCMCLHVSICMWVYYSKSPEASDAFRTRVTEHCKLNTWQLGLHQHPIQDQYRLLTPEIYLSSRPLCCQGSVAQIDFRLTQSCCLSLPSAKITASLIPEQNGRFLSSSI